MGLFHSSLGQSPFQAYEIGIQLGGKRESRHLEYNQTFLILTLPSPSSGDTRIVQPGRGVKVNHIYYWCQAFRDPEVEKTAVDVKIDPFNVSIAYLLSAYQLEEKFLKQRLQALENQTVLNLIEGKPLSQNSLQFNHLEEKNKDSEVLVDLPSSEENLESYGEF